MERASRDDYQISTLDHNIVQEADEADEMRSPMSMGGQDIYRLTSLHQSTPLLTTMSEREGDKVLKIELAEPPRNLGIHMADLPTNVRVDRVKVNVRHTANKALEGRLRKLWWAEFNSTQSTAIICDSFWYVVCKLFKPGRYEKIEAFLYNRIARNYVGLFLRVDKDFKHVFFNDYYDYLAQSVFYSLFYAYPKSRTSFNDEFKHLLLEFFSEMLTGIKVSGDSTDRWRLDLGTGDVLSQTVTARKEKKLQYASFLPDLEFKKRGKKKILAKGNMVQTELRYSPLVGHYLNTKKYEAVNSVRPWTKMLQQRKRDQEKIDQRFDDLIKLANDAVDESNKERKKHKSNLRETWRKAKANKLECARQLGRLEYIKKKRIESGSQEYCNFLVSIFLSRQNDKNSTEIDYD
eukprot:CAMPEP_0114997576 /NCGR_PEP_ID=MMETSP0216-20121206/14982_1 /TAXON_ID=223996 /ORGANISM="Protocruzia adherens, Strain Boccale" /LENGTH=405 /DNA_ID=CAMNT_0002361985 /DNA_START=218 /DNA_END=1435 /DNA_ORIENTATION=-